MNILFHKITKIFDTKCTFTYIFKLSLIFIQQQYRFYNFNSSTNINQNLIKIIIYNYFVHNFNITTQQNVKNYVKKNVKIYNIIYLALVSILFTNAYYLVS